MSIHDYFPAEFEPRHLTKEEVEESYQVIHSFFDFMHLPQVREHLWDWLKLTVSGNYPKESITERANLLYFYERIQQLIEAAHILHQKGKYLNKD